MTEEEIRKNIQAIRERIAAAASRSGRQASDIRLMAVTKTVEESRVRRALEAGIDLCGENYIQESRTKVETIGHPPQWHMIGQNEFFPQADCHSFHIFLLFSRR